MIEVKSHLPLEAVEMSKSTFPLSSSLSDYLADESILEYPFRYPSEYLACIAWHDRDLDGGGDGHAMSFLPRSYIATDLATFVRRTTRRPLVPFARGDNGDWLLCFDGKGTGDVYVILLGEKRLRVRKAKETGFVNFINGYREDLDLPPWQP